MNSVRPWNTQTVPRRPGGGAQRANRSATPSGVFSVPTTQSSGTGLAGMGARLPVTQAKKIYETVYQIKNMI
jgi:hypothetical protein